MSIKTLDRDKKYKLIIAFLLFVGIAIKCYKFGAILDCTQSDEMGSAYDAWALLNYGTDRYGNSWPVYFMNHGRGSSAMYTYLCALSIKILGYSKFSIRFPALVCSAMGAVFGCLLIGELTGRENTTKRYRAQIVFSALYALAPYTYMNSRLALDCNLMFSFSTVFLFVLVLAYQKESGFFYFLAGLMAGVTLYTYAISYLVLPLMSLFSLVYMLMTEKLRIKYVIVYAFPLLVLAIPLVLVQYINLFDKKQMVIGIFTITRMSEYASSELGANHFFSNIISAIKAVILYDNVPYNTNKMFLTFYPMSVVFFVYGLIILFKKAITAFVKREQELSAFVFIWMICELIVAGMITEPNTNRLNGIMFAVMFCIVEGVCNCLDLLPKKAVIPFGATVATVYCVYFAVFLYTYFNVLGYQDITDSSMCPEVYERIKEDPKLSGKVIASNMPPHTFIATALPSPDQINEKGDYVDELYTCYKYSDLKTLKEYFFNVGGMGQVYLVYRPSEEDIALMEECNATIERYGHSFYVFYWK